MCGVFPLPAVAVVTRSSFPGRQLWRRMTHVRSELCFKVSKHVTLRSGDGVGRPVGTQMRPSQTCESDAHTHKDCVGQSSSNCPSLSFLYSCATDAQETVLVNGSQSYKWVCGCWCSELWKTPSRDSWRKSSFSQLLDSPSDIWWFRCSQAQHQVHEMNCCLQRNSLPLDRHKNNKRSFKVKVKGLLSENFLLMETIDGCVPLLFQCNVNTVWIFKMVWKCIFIFIVGPRKG